MDHPHALFSMYGSRRRTASEGSSQLQRLATTKRRSSHRHSMDDSASVKKVVLRKHSGEPIPSSRSLSQKLARSEVENITGFWSRRLSAQKRTVVSKKHPDIYSSKSDDTGKSDDTVSPTIPSSATSTYAPSLDKGEGKSYPRPLPRPSATPFQSLSRPEITYAGSLIPNRSLEPLQASVSRSSEVNERVDLVPSSSVPPAPPLPSLPRSPISQPTVPEAPPLGSHVPTPVGKEVKDAKEKDKKRFPIFPFSKLVPGGLSGSKKAASVSSNVIENKTASPTADLNISMSPVPMVPPIYRAHAHAKVLQKQMSERRKKRKTGLAQIVIELAVGAVAQQVDSEAIQAAEAMEILARLRRLKAA